MTYEIFIAYLGLKSNFHKEILELNDQSYVKVIF